MAFFMLKSTFYVGFKTGMPSGKTQVDRETDRCAAADEPM